MEIKKHVEKLGLKARDLVTGKEGIITSVGFDLYGCVQVIMTTQITDTNKEAKSDWYDIARLKILSKKPVMKVPNYEFGEVAKGLKGGFIKPLR